MSKPRRPVPRPKVCISMDAKLLAQIERAARAMELSRSEWIALACRDAFEQGRDFVKVMSDRTVREAMFRAFTEPGVVAAIGRAMGQEVTAGQSQQVLEFFKQAKGVQ